MEAVMGGTVIKMVEDGQSLLVVDLCDREVAVDVSKGCEKKLEALRAYEAVFKGHHTELLDKDTAGDRYVGILVGLHTLRP